MRGVGRGGDGGRYSGPCREEAGGDELGGLAAALEEGAGEGERDESLRRYLLRIVLSDDSVRCATSICCLMLECGEAGAVAAAGGTMGVAAAGSLMGRPGEGERERERGVRAAAPGYMSSCVSSSEPRGVIAAAAAIAAAA